MAASRARKAAVPVNVICGPLGVGKTTCINHLLDLRPDHERWAVLVNEYGLVGLDAALMGAAAAGERTSSGGVEVKEVAGGCICCSAGVVFEVSLVSLLRRRPDRLLIEPTGLAAVSGILDTLDRDGIRASVDVRTVVCLIDPANREAALQREIVRDQVEAADVLLANRADLATPEQLGDFFSWARGLFPPKRSVEGIEQGRVPLEVLDLVSGRRGKAHRGGHRHGTDHRHHQAHSHGQEDDSEGHHEHSHSRDQGEASASAPVVRREHRSASFSTLGWVCSGDLTLDGAQVSGWVREAARLPNVIRVKAAVRTSQGWLGYNFSAGDGEAGGEVKPSCHRRDSRLEMIVEGEGCYPDADALEAKLRACVLDPAPT